MDVTERARLHLQSAPPQRLRERDDGAPPQKAHVAERIDGENLATSWGTLAPPQSAPASVHLSSHRDPKTGSLHLNLRPSTGQRHLTATSPASSDRPFTATTASGTTQHSSPQCAQMSNARDCTPGRGQSRQADGFLEGSQRSMVVHTSGPWEADDPAPFATQLTAGWGFAGQLETAQRRSSSGSAPRVQVLMHGRPALLLGPQRRAALASWKGITMDVMTWQDDGLLPSSCQFPLGSRYRG